MRAKKQMETPREKMVQLVDKVCNKVGDLSEGITETAKGCEAPFELGEEIPFSGLPRFKATATRGERL